MLRVEEAKRTPLQRALALVGHLLSLLDRCGARTSLNSLSQIADLEGRKSIADAQLL